jgi:hypothetical protein
VHDLDVGAPERLRQRRPDARRVGAVRLPRRRTRADVFYVVLLVADAKRLFVGDVPETVRQQLQKAFNRANDEGWTDPITGENCLEMVDAL